MKKNNNKTSSPPSSDSTKDNLETLNYLSNLCINKSKVMTRMTLLCLQTNKYPAIVERTLVFMKYIQLITQVILYNFFLNGNSDSYASDWYSKAIIFIAKLFNPAFWISYTKENEKSIFSALIATIIFIVIRYAIFLYVVYTTYKNQTGNPILIKLWGYIFKIQGRIIYSLISTFWVNTILYFSEIGFTSSGLRISGAALTIVSAFIIATEYSFSLYLQLRFCYVLPAPGLLAARNNYTEILLLSQKVLIHLLVTTLKSNSDSTTNLWIFSIINLTFCLIRDYQYFTRLPFYNLKTLAYQGVLLEVFTSLNLACFLQSATKSSNFKEHDMAFLLILWIIIAILFIRIALQYLENMKMKAFLTTECHPRLITHKISVLKSLRGLLQIPVEAHKTYKWSYLINNSVNINIPNILSGIDNSLPENTNINSKKSLNQMILVHLEGLASKHPKNDFLQLYIAYFYAKKLNLFCNAVKIITDLQKQNFSNTVSNASLMIFEIQNVLKSKYTNRKTKLDFFTYSVSLSKMASLQIKMFEQADMQVQICQELIKDAPDLAIIYNSAQKVHRLRINIIKNIDEQFKVSPEYYIHPFVTAAEYHLKVNHSFSDYNKNRKMYLMKYRRYERDLRDPQLNNYNLYQGASVFLQLASNRNDEGKIVFCTKSVEKIFGGTHDLYFGKRFYSMMPESLQEYYAELFRNLIEKGNLQDLTQKEHLFINHSQGYAIQANYDINIHPFLTQGFYLDVIIRPVHQYKDFILVKENGRIECASRRVAQKLGLMMMPNKNSKNATGNNINIHLLNPDLEQVNDVFNSMAVKNGLLQRKATSQSQLIARISAATAKMTKQESLYQTKSEFPGDNHEPENLSEEANQEDLDLHTLYSQGTEIYLHSLLHTAPLMHHNSKESSEIFSSYLYRIKIQTLLYGTNLVKLFLLEEIKSNDHEFDPSKIVQPETKRTNYQTTIEQKNSNQEEDELCNLEDSEDKDNDQSINIKSFAHKDSLFPSITSLAENLPTDIPFLSKNSNPFYPSLTVTEPRTNAPSKASSTWKLARKATGIHDPFSQANIAKLKAQQMQQNITLRSVTIKTNDKEEDTEKRREIIIPKFIAEGSVATSKLSTQTNFHRASNAFHRAVNTRHYSKFFKIASFVLYVALLIILALQINLKLELDSTIDNLAAKRRVVGNLHLRDYHSVYLEVVLRKVWDITTGRLNVENLGAFALYAPAFLQWGADRVTMLSAANKDMLRDSNFMDRQSKDALFESDIRIYENLFPSVGEDYVKMTSFQATGRIVESGLKILASQANLLQAEAQFDFIFRNALNDLLVQNSQISLVFTGSIRSEKDNMMTQIRVYLAVEVFGLILLAGLFTIIISRQYRNEKKGMIAVTRLNNQKIEKCIETLKVFKIIIQSENFEDQHHLQDHLTHTKSLNYNKSNPKSKRDSKSEHLKNPKLTALTKKYYLYTFKFLIFIFGLIALSFFSYSIDINSMGFFETKERQMEFTESMRTRLYLANIASQELLSTLNDTATIENIPCSKYLQDAIDMIPSMRIVATDIYKNKNGAEIYDERIKQLLYTDGCSSLGINYEFVCSLLTAYGAGSKPGLMYLLDVLEGTLTGVYQKYLLSDKTEQELIAIQSADFTKLTAVAEVLGGQTTKISDILFESFQEELDSVQSKRKTVMIIFALFVVAIGFIVRYLVLKRLRESENKFKNVLKLFPANLVLSSFLLKNFLVDTSEGALDCVKNEI